jgi:hypothetical protein
LEVSSSAEHRQYRRVRKSGIIQEEGTGTAGAYVYHSLDESVHLIAEKGEVTG